MERRLGFRLLVGSLLVLGNGCGGKKTTEPTPETTSPLPVVGIAGRDVSVYPMTLIASEESLGWEQQFKPRREALNRVDSLIASFLTERAPEVTWILPAALRRAARKAPGMLPNPDQMGTALLRSRFTQLPDPLRSQLRALTGVAGGRYALIPASLVFLAQGDTGIGRAELTMVMVDVRTARVGWRTVARGEDADPWVAVRKALKGLLPGLP